MDFNIIVNKKLIELKIELISPFIPSLFDNIKPIMNTIRVIYNSYKLIVPTTN